MKTFKTWRTVTLGPKPALSGVNVSSYAQSMMEKIDYPVEQQTIDLVRLTVRELGFETYTTTTQIYAKAKKLGLELCPPQAGPQLRMEYLDQPLGEWLHIAMEPIADSDGNPNVFNLERHEDGSWLYTYWALPDDGWDPEHEFVFSHGKSLEPLKTKKTLRNLDSLALRVEELEEKMRKIEEVLRI